MNVPALLTNASIGFGPGGPLPAPSPWTSYGHYIFYGNGGIVVGTPTGGNQGPGTLNAVNLYINGLSIDPGNFLQLSGGTVNGNLTINGSFTMNGPVDGVTLDMGIF